MEGPNREVDWHMVDDDLHRHMNRWLAAAGGFLKGRVTYELMKGFWATALAHALDVARSLKAAPLIAEINRLATRAHLDMPTHAPPTKTVPNDGIDQLGLTPREAEVLTLVATGQTNSQIASALFISEKTASVHVSNILRKLDVRSRLEAAAIAQRLLDDPP